MPGCSGTAARLPALAVRSSYEVNLLRYERQQAAVQAAAKMAPAMMPLQLAQRVERVAAKMATNNDDMQRHVPMQLRSSSRSASPFGALSSPSPAAAAAAGKSADEARRSLWGEPRGSQSGEGEGGALHKDLPGGQSEQVHANQHFMAASPSGHASHGIEGDADIRMIMDELAGGGED